MTSAGPEPQIEYVRELIVTGDLGPLNALLDLEAGLSTDQTFRQVKRITLTLFGPIVRGTSTYWLIHDGCHPVLSSYRCSRERTLIDFDPFHFSVSPDATLQQVYDQIAASDVDPCHVLRVGLLRAIPLPHDRLRLFFAVAGFETPSLFWPLVDGLTAELHRLGFRSVDLGQPSPDTAPPEPDPGAPSLPGKPEEPQRSDPLDRWFDWRASCRALSYWVTLRDIAAKTSYSLDTIKKKHALYVAEHRPQNKAPKSTK
jgi:hypothetical protein